MGLERCKDCIHNWGVTQCKLFGECRRAKYLCACRKKIRVVEWDGILYADIIKHHFCLFCEDSYKSIRKMDNETLAEHLKQRYLGVGRIDPTTAVPIDISGCNEGITFTLPAQGLRIKVPWEEAAEYLRTWADKCSLECSTTTLIIGGYLFERLCINGRNTVLREKLNEKAFEYGVTPALMEKAWDHWECSVYSLNKAMVDGYIALSS